ncbi:hypothetical protein BDV59DRAFT_194415 [Aspergillus ambiguus]|uniref:uncharacterized protein n=1 Tax=Aspergillus ambiguus TaxID=176160 RepID=UPI003CCD214B
MATLTPSSADEGYFLSIPPLPNPADSDAVFQRILQWHLPNNILSQITPRLRQFAAEAISEQVNIWIGNAETQQPYIKTRNVWGARFDRDRLITSEGWRQLGKWGLRNGNYIFSAASAAFSCPVSMTSGACRLVRHHLSVPSDHPFHYLYARLTSRDDPWVSAQWMTERAGGSDVRNSETIAVYSPLTTKSGRFGRIDQGDYLLSGFKFFSSATDCNVALILAKTESGQLSLFVAPTLRTVTGEDGKEKEVTNGIRIHRLKNKFGTKELPTAEVELKGVRAHLIGPKDRGIATIALLLNVTRTHNFITALSCLRRAMDIAKAFARSRKTIDQPLWAFPMHLQMLAQLEVKHRGWMQLAFFTTSLLSYCDHGFPPGLPGHYALLAESPELAATVLRAFTSTSKAVICKSATLAFQECQEAMGGVGYIDEPEEPEFNVSRLWRDTASNSVWEGTSNVLASEVVRHLARGKNIMVFDTWVKNLFAGVQGDVHRNTLLKAWEALRMKMDPTQVPGGLTAVLADGRQIMFTLSWVISGALLALDAERDEDPIAIEVARRWILQGQGLPAEFTFPSIIHSYWSLFPDSVHMADQEKTNWDCRIVWGVDLPRDSSVGYRLSVPAKI